MVRSIYGLSKSTQNLKKIAKIYNLLKNIYIDNKEHRYKFREIMNIVENKGSKNNYQIRIDIINRKLPTYERELNKLKDVMEEWNRDLEEDLFKPFVKLFYIVYKRRGGHIKEHELKEIMLNHFGITSKTYNKFFNRMVKMYSLDVRKIKHGIGYKVIIENIRLIEI